MAFLAIRLFCVSSTEQRDDISDEETYEICDNRITAEGHETLLDCQCTGSSTAAIIGNETCQGTHIRWYDDETVIGDCSNGDVVINDPYHWTMTINADEQLVISAAYSNNTGQYTCEKYQTGSFVTDLEVQGRSGCLLTLTRTAN